MFIILLGQPAEQNDWVVEQFGVLGQRETEGWGEGGVGGREGDGLMQ